jgi:hypothetical protein
MTSITTKPISSTIISTSTSTSNTSSPSSSSYIREPIDEFAKQKNATFVETMKQNILRPYVTRTWGGRKLDTRSEAWKSLRQSAYKRDRGICRFCGVKAKWFVCDHIDGNAGNNALENLGVNCSLCDMVRHCGFNGMQGYIVLRSSKLSQIQIVKRTRILFRQLGRMPRISEVDPKAKVVLTITKRNGTILYSEDDVTDGASIVDLANILLRFNYDDLDDSATDFKAFYTPRAEARFYADMTSAVVPSSSTSSSTSTVSIAPSSPSSQQQTPITLDRKQQREEEGCSNRQSSNKEKLHVDNNYSNDQYKQMNPKYQKDRHQTSQTARYNSSQSSSHLSSDQLHLSKQQSTEQYLPQSKQVDSWRSNTRLERKEQIKSVQSMITSWLTADVNAKQDKQETDKTVENNGF